MNDKPILVIKLGDKEKGWIPSKESFKAVEEFVEKSELREKFNVLIFHYGIEVEIINSSKDLGLYGLQIVDEDKFYQFVENYEKQRQERIKHELNVNKVY